MFIIFYMNIDNPYEKVYENNRTRPSTSTSIHQAENLAKHLSMIYNTFGIALKDIISLLSFQYPPQKLNQVIQNSQQQTKFSSSEVQKKGVSKILVQPVRANNKKSLNTQKWQRSTPKQFEQFEFKKYEHKPSLQNKKRSAPKTAQEVHDKERKPSKIKNVIQEASKNIERVEAGRNKKQREVLNGYSCLECEKFYQAIGEQFNNKDGKNKLKDRCSRHRSNLPPTNFFTNFTQEFGFDDDD